MKQINSRQTKLVNQIANCDKLKPYPKNSDGSFKVKTADTFQSEFELNIKNQVNSKEIISVGYNLDNLALCAIIIPKKILPGVIK